VVALVPREHAAGSVREEERMVSGAAGVVCVRCLQPGEPSVGCRVCRYPDTPRTFVLVYESQYSSAAMRAFRKDAARMAQWNYVPMGQPEWVPGEEDDPQRLAARFLLGFVANLARPTGYLRVEYRRSDLTPDEAAAPEADAIRWGG
jgi:hypothetical protein